MYVYVYRYRYSTFVVNQVLCFGGSFSRCLLVVCFDPCRWSSPVNDVTAPVAVLKLSREEEDRIGFIFELYTGPTDNHPSNNKERRERERNHE